MLYGVAQPRQLGSTIQWDRSSGSSSTHQKPAFRSQPCERVKALDLKCVPYSKTSSRMNVISTFSGISNIWAICMNMSSAALVAKESPSSKLSEGLFGGTSPPQFNPFNVRTTRKLTTYAKTLAAKIRTRTYKPMPAVIHYVPKGDGKRRTLNIFQLPDAAISNLVFKSLLQKNVGRFSAYAYAYREDKTPHDAVNEIFNEW